MFQKKLVEKIKTRVLCSITFFFENRAVYVIMWKNIVQPDRPQITTWRMRIASWITTATYITHTHTHTHTLIIYNTYCFFHCNNDCTNAPHCYVMRILPVMIVVTERYSGNRVAYYGVRRKSPLILSEGNYGM